MLHSNGRHSQLVVVVVVVLVQLRKAEQNYIVEIEYCLPELLSFSFLLPFLSLFPIVAPSHLRRVVVSQPLWPIIFRELSVHVL